jgi:hypothetical protein
MLDQQQYIRNASLIVADAKGNGLDLASLRIVFKVKKSSAQTPNAAIIRVYNLSDNTAKQIRDEFQSVTLQAGYQSNFGLIFKGNIKQVRFGRENSTDTYVDIAAGDGDQSYNFSTISTTLSAGSQQTDQINAAINTMEPNGVTTGFIDDIDSIILPRGKVMYGMSRDYLRQSTESTNTTWSIQNEQIQIVKRTSVAPDPVVVLTSKTGLVGVPELTNDGVSARCLLNPLIRIGGIININQKDIADAKLSNVSNNLQVNSAPQTTADGLYRVLVAEFVGDTFGNDWYTDITCISYDNSAPDGEKVSIS